MTDLLWFLRRKRTRVLCEFLRQNVQGQLVEISTGKDTELCLRLKRLGKDKPFAEISLQDVGKVGLCLTDAERWIGNLLAKARP